MINIIGLLKNNKKITSVAGVALLIGLFFFTWNKIERGIFDRGYSTAVKEHQQLLIDTQNRYTEELNKRLLNLRLELQEQHQRELDRVSANTKIDERVITVKEYIEKEIYVKEECNAVPVTLNRMFNESIRSINNPSK